MKSLAAVLVLVCFGTGAFAQQSPQQPISPVKMECRDLASSGNVLSPNETSVNGMACHVVDAKPAASPVASVNLIWPLLIFSFGPTFW
jgi:hypothetical protein